MPPGGATASLGLAARPLPRPCSWCWPARSCGVSTAGSTATGGAPQRSVPARHPGTSFCLADDSGPVLIVGCARDHHHLAHAAHRLLSRGWNIVRGVARLSPQRGSPAVDRVGPQHRCVRRLAITVSCRRPHPGRPRRPRAGLQRLRTVLPRLLAIAGGGPGHRARPHRPVPGRLPAPRPQVGGRPGPRATATAIVPPSLPTAPRASSPPPPGCSRHSTPATR